MSEEKPNEKPEKKSDSITYAIILLTVVIAVIGAPFALNEYEKWKYNENLKEAYSRAIVAYQPTFTQKIITRVITPIRTPIQTPIPTPIPVIQHKISDGYWCRDTTMNLGKAPTDVKECYQFFADGTFKWGYFPGYPMGKSPSCWSPNVRCEYKLNSRGQYEVQGGYTYTLSDNMLVDPHDPPYFKWSSTGVP